MKVYLTELGGEVEHFYLPHTQNLIVDYMLNNVISELQQFSNFSYQIRGKFSEKLHISNRDLSALIGNALENAKEALIKVEKEKRLELEIKSHNQFVFEKMSDYIWSFAGGDGMDTLETQYKLIDLFSEAAADGLEVLDVTGKDVAGFCDELIRGNKSWLDSPRKRLNRSIRRQ